jgi:hypothetical protein
MMRTTGKSSADQPFALTKWYFDCICDNGRAAIGYYVRLTWGRLSLTWQALSVWEAGRRTLERSSLAGSPTPSRSPERITWNAPGLGCSVAADVCQPCAALRLFKTATGFVDWRCEAPLAHVTIELAGAAPLHGIGYVECLELTIPPWQLPIRELRWGRWADHDARHSIVWVDWRGESPNTWVLVDGVHASAMEVQDDGVDLATSKLTLTSDQTLSSRAPEDIIFRIPPLRAIVPDSLLALREVKWLSRGAWRRAGEATAEGPALHERVVFR